MKQQACSAERDITLYHGSPNGIIGIIAPISEKICDFGQGFYTATEKEYALSNIVEREQDGCGFCYTLRADTEDLRVYEFGNELSLWMLYTAYNRGYIPSLSNYDKLRAEIESIEVCDVVCGLIADDRSAYAFGRFLDGAMTDLCLIECMKYFELGLQYAFKTTKACNALEIVESEVIRGEAYTNASHEKRKRIGTSQEVVAGLEKQYRREGLFIDELLERYR